MGLFSSLFGGGKTERTCSRCGATGRDFAELVRTAEWIIYRGSVVAWCSQCEEWVCEKHTRVNPDGRGAQCIKCGTPFSPDY